VCISKINQLRLGEPLARHAVALQFNVETVAEQPLQHLAARRRDRMLPGDERAVEWSIGTAGQRNQPASGVIKPGYLDVRPLLRRGFKIRARTQPHQAAVAALVGGEQNQAWPIVFDVAVFDVAEIDRHGAADDRLNPGARQLFRELQRAEHVVGIGQGERRLPILLRELGQACNR
jgi:hypothetical protein